MPWTDHTPCYPQSSCHIENCTEPREYLLHKQSGNQFPGLVTHSWPSLCNECEGVWDTDSVFWMETQGRMQLYNLYFPAKYSFHSAWFSGPGFVVKLAHMCGRCWQLTHMTLNSMFDIKWLPLNFLKLYQSGHNVTSPQVTVKMAPTVSNSRGRTVTLRGWPGGSALGNPTNSAEAPGSLTLISGLGRYPGAGNGNPPVFLAGKSHGERSLGGYSPRSHEELGSTEHMLKLCNCWILGPLLSMGSSLLMRPWLLQARWLSSMLEVDKRPLLAKDGVETDNKSTREDQCKQTVTHTPVMVPGVCDCRFPWE